MARGGYHTWRMLFTEDKTAALRPDPLWDEQGKKKSQKGSLKLSAPLWKNPQCCEVLGLSQDRLNASTREI